MIIDILTQLHLVEILHAAGGAAETQVSITDLTFPQIIALVAKISWVWIGVPLTLFLWFKAGFLYVTAEGSSEKLNKAHESIKVSLIWTVVAVLVYGLLLAASEGLAGIL